MIDPAQPRDALAAAHVRGERSAVPRAPRSGRTRPEASPEPVDMAALARSISLRLDTVLDGSEALRQGEVTEARQADGGRDSVATTPESVPRGAATDAQLQLARRRLEARRALARRPPEPRMGKLRRWNPGSWLPRLMWGAVIAAVSALVAVAVL